MKTFFAQLSDGSTIMKPAERMEIVDDSIRAYANGELVAFMDVGATLYAHIYEKGGCNGKEVHH